MDNLAEKISRRKALKFSMQSAALTALGPLAYSPPLNKDVKAEAVGVISNRSLNGKIVVIGAGAFGGWTALHLLRRGYKVTLVDQFGPGNNQSSSGGETRLIRAFYGDQQVYFDMTLRALDLWKQNEPLMGQKVLHQNGLAVFLANSKDIAVDAAVPMYKKAGLTFEKVSVADAAKRWPQVNYSDIDHVMYDPTAGFLESRKGCMVVSDLFAKEGGTFLHQQVKQESIKDGKCASVTLFDDTVLEADSFIFACGPWLIRLFPEITKKLKITRQVIFFFASPPGESDLMENKLPTYFNKDINGVVDAYGVPGNEYRGFKIAYELDDVINDKFDTYNRYYKPEELEHIQKLLAHRFPKMAGRPLIENRVCQYTETPDKDFILDKHPGADNLWIMGGGSGHGYKMGASFGEMAASMVTGEKQVMEKFAIKRLLG